MSTQSCLYEGVVWHRRSAPLDHEFRYRLFLLYVDLDELPTLFRGRWLWSTKWPSLAWFRRADHLGPVGQPLSEAVRDLVEARCAARPIGPIRLLTHFRYLGFAMNPLSLYYCFNADEHLDFIVAEVNNTPWGEQHCYVLDVRKQNDSTIRAVTSKQLHVSPFLSMNFNYEFQFSQPGPSLAVQIANLSCDQPGQLPIFTAALALHRRPFNGRVLARALLRYPLMTWQVFAGIYWQAFLLWRKGLSFVPHPQKIKTDNDRRLSATSDLQQSELIASTEDLSPQHSSP